MKIRAKSLTTRQAVLLAGFIAGLLVMAIGISNLHGHILTSLMSQSQMHQAAMPQILGPQVPVPLATGELGSQSRPAQAAKTSMAKTR